MKYVPRSIGEPAFFNRRKRLIKLKDVERNHEQSG